MKHTLAISFVTAVVLVACGGGGAPSSPSTSARPVASAAATSSAAASSAAGINPPSPSPSSPAAQASSPATGPIKVGVIEPQTGSLANIGKDNQDGLKLYLDSIHSTVAGRKIEPLFVDSQGKPDVALTKAKELVDNEKVAVLMGINTTPEGYALAQWDKDAGHIPMLITANAGGEGMLTNPKFKSPYLSRWTQSGTEIVDVAADWAIKQGYRKADLLNSDFAPGVQNADIFGSTFVRRGGTILQELYPPLGTTDFGPYLAELNKSADVIFTFFPGLDGLRFGQQYQTYAGQTKAQILDSFGTIVAGPNLAQLQNKAQGIVAVDVFSSASPDPGTQAFLKEWHAAYPDRLLSHDVPMGYASGQILAAAIQKVDGRVEDAQPFLQALDSLKLDTAKGPLQLDENHDIVQNIDVFRIVKQGSGVGYKMLQVYDNVSDTWARNAHEIAAFPWEKLKGQWVGMTKAKLDLELKQ